MRAKLRDKLAATVGLCEFNEEKGHLVPVGSLIHRIDYPRSRS
jgi:hypothetical protein